MSPKKIKIGILGTASIAERYILPSLLDLSEHFELIGVASREKKTADLFANRNQIIGYYSYEALLKNKQLDAVYIPLPNSLHYDWVKNSLSLGLHVLVEKSLACTYDQVLELNELARSKQLALVENFQFRFHSQLEYISKLVGSGTIGELRCLRSSFGFPPFKDKNNIRYEKELGGGALLDAGAYPLKVAQHFLGLDLHVSAGSLHLDDEKGVDIWGGAYLKQNKGSLFAEIAFGFDNFYQCNLELWGTDGILKAERIFTSPPGHVPTLILHTASGERKIELECDNHFKNMLLYFHKLCSLGDEKARQTEYIDNINQARLINELFSLA